MMAMRHKEMGNAGMPKCYCFASIGTMKESFLSGYMV